MEKKTIWIITVIGTTFLCGLPGLAGLCLGSLALLGAIIPDSGLPGEDTGLIIGGSIMILGLSLIFIAIPIGLGFWAWWSQKTEAAILEKTVVPEDDF
jgi:hypothetical protein